MTPDQTVDLIDFLSRAYPAWKPSEGTAAVYCDGLSDLSSEDVVAACRVLVRTAKFAPSVAEIREMVQAGKGPAHMPWDEAWQMLRESVSPRGYGRSYDFPDIALAAAKAVGGVDSIGRCDAKELPFLANRFRDAYESRCELATKHGDQMIAKGEEPRLPASILRLMGDGVRSLSSTSNN